MKLITVFSLRSRPQSFFNKFCILTELRHKSCFFVIIKNPKKGVAALKKYLDIEVHVENDYVYMSKRDWRRLVEVLKKISRANFELTEKEKHMLISGSKTLH